MTEEEIDQKYNHDLNDLIRRHIRHEVSEEEYKKERDRIGNEYEQGIKNLKGKYIGIKKPTLRIRLKSQNINLLQKKKEGRK